MNGFRDLHAAVLAETDPQKQKGLRNASLLADYYLGSVHALAQTGEMIIASASGSQLPPIVFTSPNLIFVVGTQKIQATYDEAMKRLQEYVVPLENERMKSTGAAGTMLAKIFTFEREPAFMGRKVRVILVKEELGFQILKLFLWQLKNLAPRRSKRLLMTRKISPICAGKILKKEISASKRRLAAKQAVLKN